MGSIYIINKKVYLKLILIKLKLKKAYNNKVELYNKDLTKV